VIQELSTTEAVFPRDMELRSLGLRVKKNYTKEYRAWSSMMTRCYNKNCENYKNYGAKGVTVVEKWRRSSIAFIIDMGMAGSKKLSLDRIKRDLPYGPDNCRWATTKQQTRNQSSNRTVIAFGESKCMSEWAEDPRCAVSYSSLQKRLNAGWTANDAITRSPRDYHFAATVLVAL